MLGAIAGDVIGSVCEGKKAWQRERTPRFEPLFAPEACFLIRREALARLDDRLRDVVEEFEARFACGS